MRAPRILVTICLFLIAATASASWYDDYNDGLAAARTGNWAVVAQKMSAAIAVKPKENNKERAYGTIFINYHPYYYRGVANLNLGRYDQAVSDLETATGPGPENLGSIDMLIQMAKTKQQSGSPAVAEQPRPPAPQPPAPQPVVPATPVIDGALRGRAQAALQQARARVQAAQQRNAGAPQAAQALQQYTDINTRFANARSNADLEAVIAMTDNVVLLADSVTQPGPAVAVTPPAATITPRPAAATDIVLADSRRQVRQALENYFAGEFDAAARSLERLTGEMKTNAWLWAFLGASYYSQYAFEADEAYRVRAIAAFDKAKKLGKFRNGLPDRYFSRRIRRAFDNAGS